MIRQWGHTHSLGIGALLGITLADRHQRVLLALAFTIGLLIGRFWAALAWGARWVARRAERASSSNNPWRRQSIMGEPVGRFGGMRGDD